VIHAFPCGTAALDFLGTRRARRNVTPLEKLDTPSSLDAWFVEAGLLDSGPDASPADLDAARELRETIYSLVAERLGGDAAAATPSRADAVASLNRFAATAPITLALTADGSTRTGDTRAALASVAREAIDILGGEDAPLLRECARPECTQVYLDRSRGHRREWCSMRTCGNRVKASTFRARQREAAES
jgi:predicted RNA-binding Zn ribbon-like protein